MNEPSMVSSRHMPAVNSTGRHKMAYHGRPAAALVPASTSSATSVAVSKPRPNRTPTGYICHDAVTDLVNGPATDRAIRGCSTALPVRLRRNGRGASA